MSMMRQAAQDYLTLRRALGFKLDKPGGLVLRFAEHLDRLGTCQVSVDLALRWAREPAQADPSWWAYRLSAVRDFTAYLQPRLPGIEVPPADLLPLRTKRATYLYSAADVHALMVAARGLRSPLRAATYETLIGLLAVTGLRVGEAINLNRGDVDLAAGMLTVHNGKFGNSREVPLHPSTARALCAYAERRAQLLPAPSAANFFLSTTGTRLSDCRVESTFRALVRGAGLQPRSARCRPRLHDLRHSFAVNTVLDWYRHGCDVQAKMPLLSCGCREPCDGLYQQRKGLWGSHGRVHSRGVRQLGRHRLVLLWRPERHRAQRAVGTSRGFRCGGGNGLVHPAVGRGVRHLGRDHAQRQLLRGDQCGTVVDQRAHRCDPGGADDLRRGDHRTQPVRHVDDLLAAGSGKEVLTAAGDADHLVGKHRADDQGDVVVHDGSVEQDRVRLAV